MPPIPLNLGTGSDPSRNHQLSGVRHINCFAAAMGSEAKSPVAIKSFPGLTRWDSGTYSGGVRAVVDLDDDTLVSVIGNLVFEYDKDGAATETSAIIGTGRLYSAVNMKSTTQICFVTSDNQAFLYESGSITQITDSDLKTPTSVTWLDGYFIFSHTDGTFSLSALNEGANIDAGDNATAESDRDGIVRVFAHNGALAVLGTKSFEWWQNTGNSTFPFEPLQSDINIGCMAGHTVQKLVNALVWVDNNSVVQRMTGTTPQRISNSSVEEKISDLTEAQQAALEADVFWADGRQYYALQSPGNWTYCFNAKEQKWIELKSYGQNDWRATYSSQFAGKWIVGDRSDGKLYHVDHNAFTENGNNHLMEIYAPNTHRFPHNQTVSALEVDLIRGTGLNTTDPHNSDPQIMLSWSNDGGNTYTNEMRQSFGQQGDYDAVVRFNRLGMIRRQGRNWRLAISAACDRAIIAANMIVP